MRSIGKIFSFSAAHHLPHHRGQCKAHHGHNYKLEVEIIADIQGIQTSGPAQGMIMDFGELDEIVEETVLFLHDHKNLNKIYTNPTAETMVEAFARDINNALPFGFMLLSLKLWETEKCYARWITDQYLQCFQID